MAGLETDTRIPPREIVENRYGTPNADSVQNWLRNTPDSPSDDILRPDIVMFLSNEFGPRVDAVVRQSLDDSKQQGVLDGLYYFTRPESIVQVIIFDDSEDPEGQRCRIIRKTSLKAGEVPTAALRGIWAKERSRMREYPWDLEATIIQDTDAEHTFLGYLNRDNYFRWSRQDTEGKQHKIGKENTRDAAGLVYEMLLMLEDTDTMPLRQE